MPTPTVHKSAAVNYSDHECKLKENYLYFILAEKYELCSKRRHGNVVSLTCKSIESFFAVNKDDRRGFNGILVSGLENLNINVI